MSSLMLKEIILENQNGKLYPYHFSDGVNYFKGGNGCGKTEFLKFIDYLLGSSSIKLNGEWYNKFSKGTLVFEKKGTLFKFSRTCDNNIYFFQINNEPEEQCSSEQYIAYLSIMSTEENNWNLQELRNVTNVDLSLRSCTPFIFIEEIGAETNTKTNFLTKCRVYKYQKWVSIILDYIFHPNSSLIYSKRKEIELLKRRLKEQNELIEKLNLYKVSINEALHSLNSNVELTNDVDSVKNEFKRIRNFENKTPTSHVEDIYQLNDISEKIKLIDDANSDIKSFERSAETRKEMLIRLKDLTAANQEYHVYTESIIKMIEELSSTISFSRLLLQKKNSESLKKIKVKLEKSVKQKENNQTFIELDEKIRAISIGEKCLSLYEKEYKDINIDETISKLRKAEDELDELTHKLDENKISEFQKNLMLLYKSAIDDSSLVKADFELENFVLDYDEKNNAIIPSIVRFEENEKYNIHMIYRGSQARSSIIQLCGYCALQIMLQKNKTVPCLPLMVMDHFSKPFSSENMKAIGCVLSKFYELLEKQNFQVLMFDIKEPKELNLTSANEQQLINEDKSGFIPWINEKK